MGMPYPAGSGRVLLLLVDEDAILLDGALDCREQHQRRLPRVVNVLV